jgi:hypothetical protein
MKTPPSLEKSKSFEEKEKILNSPSTSDNSSPSGSPVKPRSNDILDIYRKREIKKADSPITQWSGPTSTKSQVIVELRHYMLAFTLSSFVAVLPIIHWWRTGNFFDWSLLEAVGTDLCSVVALWPLFTIWSFTAFLLQKAVLAGLPSFFRANLTFIIEMTMVIAPSYATWVNNWTFSHRIFILLQMCIHVMKMHSYNSTNYYLRREYLKNRKEPSKQHKTSSYPENINVLDFCAYFCSPVLVYWPTPPKLDFSNIRINYIMKQLVGSGICLIAIYIVTSSALYPIYLKRHELNYVEMWAFTLLPAFTIYNALFLLIWEFILNANGEAIGFPDRRFYSDWWNCQSYEEYGRKWNIIVHEFLFRHVYLELNFHAKIAKMWSAIGTVIISAIFHQIVVSVAVRKFFWFYIGMMLLQFPVNGIIDLVLKKFSGQVKNYVFFSGMFIGTSVLFSHTMSIHMD